MVTLNVGPAQYPRPIVALVGRPNVGKSTLFNRLLGQRKAITSSVFGTTRDRIYGSIDWRARSITLIDAGGLDLTGGQDVGEAVQSQALRALQEADLLVFVCDAQQGLLPADQLLMDRLRSLNKPVLVTVNKTDRYPTVPPEFFALGAAETFAVSALHGYGTSDLLDHLISRSHQGVAPHVDQVSSVGIAIVGRQNVGKSSLLNALLREDRTVVSEQPGTTRDAIDTPVLVDGRRVVLIDTAGLRHRRKVKNAVDVFSMARSTEAIGRCDVALLLLDARQGVTRDDCRIALQIFETGRGLVVGVNKWDLVKGTSEEIIERTVQRALIFAGAPPIITVSAKTGLHIQRVMLMSLGVARAMSHSVSDDECHRLVTQAWKDYPPPRFRGRVIQLRRVRYFSDRPSRIELETSPVGWLPQPYRRYLLKRIYRNCRFSGVPLKLVVQESLKASAKTKRGSR